nr:trna (guanosine(18)-2'-o)-methyltransferase [Quercus suber]
MSYLLKQGDIAELLLRRLPEPSRRAVIQDLLQSLQRDSTTPEIAIALLAAQPNGEAREGILAHLHTSLLRGNLQHVELVCSFNEGIRQNALDQVIVQLAAVSILNLQSGLERSAVRMEELFAITEEPAVLSASLEVESVVTWLRFTRSAGSSNLGVRSLIDLFRSSLILMGSADREVCVAASATFVAVFTGPAAITVDDDLVWKCIQTFTSYTGDDFYSRLGYSLWLRWAACKDMVIRDWFDESYWRLLRRGLQDGDTERRKQCLGILRRSVLDASEDSSLHGSLCSRDMGSIGRSTFEAQGVIPGADAIVESYDRFLTVFETIVLGRYLNQVIACEDELSILASSQSLVTPEWLYALLAASLGSSMQDSNRKWLGAWIMRSEFQPDHSDGMLKFFSEAFLPWAMQGSLFTGSLKESDGRARCFHGERLTAYVEHLLHFNVQDTAFTSRFLDAVLSALIARKSNSFAYSVVYVLHGLGHAVERCDDLVLNEDQTGKIAMLASWPAVPEIARDYVLIRCSKVYHITSGRSSLQPIADGALRSLPGWHSLCQSLLTSRKDAISGLGSPMASIRSDKSSRDQQEDEAMSKIQDLWTSLENGHQHPSAGELNHALQEIWNDLEYLEYPKRLVVSMPSLTLHTKVVQFALESEPLRATIVQITLSLQSLSGNRLYIFSPLVIAMRRAILASADVAAVLPVLEFIISYAQKLPEPTIDYRLEDATTHMLTSISPETVHLGYAYYFGDRESIGVAALLDLVSRVGQLQPSLLQDILHELLQRWRRQKIPTPTVSPWKSALQLQIMLLCCEVVLPNASTSDVERLMNDLHHILSIEPLPRYRYLLGWILARSYLLNVGLRTQLLTELRSTDHHSNPKFLASLMKIAVMLAKVDDAEEDFAIQLAAAFVPLAASSKVVIRHEAQWRVPPLMDHARAMGWQGIIDNPSFVALDHYIRSLDRFDTPPAERLLDQLDPVSDHNLTNLVEGKWWGLDTIETPLCGHVDFIELYSRDAILRSGSYAKSCMPLGSAIAHPPTTQSNPVADHAVPPAPVAAAELAPGTSLSSSRALQTKGTAYLQDQTQHDDRPARNDIIVIASLVDNPYNLGGLSRVSEIFGARELHLQNQNVVGNKDFTGVAVSSHLHFPICQLSAAVLPPYLAEKKAEGYAVVGIEQTDRSRRLGSPACAIPRKCVLVIGSEKEGIPALVLAECDVLVEIPQQGITRSLNVQTAAAIVLFEYARQHRMS